MPGDFFGSRCVKLAKLQNEDKTEVSKKKKATNTVAFFIALRFERVRRTFFYRRFRREISILASFSAVRAAAV
ncbi:hypothetical protein D3C72_2311840 [compost metagenome]